MSKNKKLPELDQKPAPSVFWEAITLLGIFGMAFLAFWVAHLLKAAAK